MALWLCYSPISRKNQSRTADTTVSFHPPVSTLSFEWNSIALPLRCNNLSSFIMVVVTTAVLNSLSLTVNPLKYKGKPLFGWFHLKIQSSDNTFPLTWVFSQGETQYTEAAPAGSFVPLNASNWGKSCQNDQVEKKTSIPCYFVQEPFPLVSSFRNSPSFSRSNYTVDMCFFVDAIFFWPIHRFAQG